MATTQSGVTEKEITLVLKVRTTIADDYEYFFNSDGSIQPGFIADCFDMLDMISKHIVTINGKTYAEYHQILQSKS